MSPQGRHDVAFFCHIRQKERTTVSSDLEKSLTLGLYILFCNLNILVARNQKFFDLRQYNL